MKYNKKVWLIPKKQKRVLARIVKWNEESSRRRTTIAQTRAWVLIGAVSGYVLLIHKLQLLCAAIGAKTKTGNTQKYNSCIYVRKSRQDHAVEIKREQTAQDWRKCRNVVEVPQLIQGNRSGAREKKEWKPKYSLRRGYLFRYRRGWRRKLFKSKCAIPLFSCGHPLVCAARRRVLYRPDHILKRSVNCIIHNNSITTTTLFYVQLISCTHSRMTK